MLQSLLFSFMLVTGSAALAAETYACYQWVCGSHNQCRVNDSTRWGYSHQITIEPGKSLSVGQAVIPYKESTVHGDRYSLKTSTKRRSLDGDDSLFEDKYSYLVSSRQPEHTKILDWDSSQHVMVYYSNYSNSHDPIDEISLCVRKP